MCYSKCLFPSPKCAIFAPNCTFAEFVALHKIKICNYFLSNCSLFFAIDILQCDEGRRTETRERQGDGSSVLRGQDRGTVPLSSIYSILVVKMPFYGHLFSICVHMTAICSLSIFRCCYSILPILSAFSPEHMHFVKGDLYPFVITWFVVSSYNSYIRDVYV